MKIILATALTGICSLFLSTALGSSSLLFAAGDEESTREVLPYVVFPCDQFVPDKVYPDKWMDTCSVVNQGADYGFTDFSQTYDLWVGGTVDSYGQIIQEIRALAVMEIPGWMSPADIARVEFSFFTYEHNTFPYELTNFCAIQTMEQPHAGSTNPFWSAYFIDTGDELYYAGFLDVGWHHFDLGQEAIADFETRKIDPGWFGVGMGPAWWDLWPGDSVYNKTYGGGREPEERPYFTVWYYLDDDRDGYHVPDDCDDSNPEVHPGHAEVPDNGIDDDCDGRVDEQCFVGAVWGR